MIQILKINNLNYIFENFDEMEKNLRKMLFKLLKKQKIQGTLILKEFYPFLTNFPTKKM